MRQAAQRAARKRFREAHSDNEEDSDFEMSGKVLFLPLRCSQTGNNKWFAIPALASYNFHSYSSVLRI